MDNLALVPIVKREVADYADAIGRDTFIYFLANDEQQIYVVLDVFKKTPTEPEIFIMAQVIGSFVVIHRDDTDRPLDEALIEAGIPRTQIVRLEAGETLPADIPDPHTPEP